MIKNGNYYYVNFDEHKEKFIKVLTEYYGDEFEEIIRERMDTITYVPFHKFDAVSLYYGKQMDKYREEILDAFARISGRENLTDEQKDIVWENGGSKFFSAMHNGGNLQESDYLFEGKDELLENRKKVAELFGLTNEETLIEDLKTEARNVRLALAEVTKNHPCDVFHDLDLVVRNRNHALQSYLILLNKHLSPLTEHDIELISKGTFDSYDREDLDSKNLLFGTTIEEPGLVSYFTSENQQKANSEDIYDQIEVYEGQLMFYALNAGYDKLKYVTLDELYSRVKVENTEEYFDRIKKEIAHLQEIEPSNVMTAEVADRIEEIRRSLCQGIFHGTKMTENLNRSYSGSSHNVDDPLQWLTSLGYERTEYDKPSNVIFFNEDNITTDQTLLYFIHELNHAIGHGKAILDKNKKYAISKSGVIHSIRQVIDGKYIGGVYDVAGDPTKVGEDWNHRMSCDMLDIFLAMYDNIFDESDSGHVIDESDKDICVYSYYNFMTERLWEKMKDIVKRYRMRDDASLFYDVEHHEPVDLKEYIINALDYAVKKRINPIEIHKRGEINGKIFYTLCNLVDCFENEIAQELYYKDIKPEDLMNRDDFSDLPNMTDDLNVQLQAYKYMADKLTDEILEDRQDIRDRAYDQIENDKKLKRFLNAVKNKRKVNIKISPKTPGASKFLDHFKNKQANQNNNRERTSDEVECRVLPFRNDNLLTSSDNIDMVM
jgi:hypothetical protein